MAQIIVTTLDDEYDSGATVANPGGQGLSLREAIARANALAGADEIIFAPGLSGTITLVNGFSFISSEISINGDVDGDLDADITIDANDAQAHFLVGGSGTLALNGFRLTNGNYYLGSGSIDNSGDLVVTNTTFDGNDGSQGGALFNRTGATANLTNVTFSDNSANVGGAIYNFGDLTVVNGTFAGNYAQNYGGAINNGPSGDVSLVNATLTDNEAQIDGGGIKDFAFDAVTLRNSIVLGNRSTGVVEISGDASLQAANIVGSQLSQDGVVLNVFDPSDVFRSAAGDVGELADNGGSVQTVRINAIGPAADAGSGNPPLDELDADRDGSTTDLLAGANGPARAANAFDLGAYEAVAATRIEVTNVNDSGAGSLRQAIADAGTASNVFITFADDLAGQTIALQSTLTIQSGAEITITGDVDGDGDKDVVISGDRTGNGPSLSDVRIMNVEAGAYVRLDDITLADGFDRGSNSFSNTSTGAFAVAGDGASTILSSGDVTLSNVLIANAYSSGGDGRDYPINGTRDGGDAAAIIVEGGAFRA
ncbi:MAG: choice-of-anchor Q domain-containing protein, partial [Pseudomonadota bacterium]